MFYKNVGGITILYISYRYPVLRGGPSAAAAPQVRWNSILGWIIQTSLCCSSQIKIKEIFYACKWKGCMYKFLSKWKMQWKSLKTNTEVLKVFESQMKRISIYKCQSQKNLVGWHIHPDLRLLDWIIYLPHRTTASRLELIYWNLSLNWAKSNFQHFSVSNKVFSIHLWLGSRLCSLGELSTVFTM